MDNRRRQRVLLSLFFFLAGICFSSWASRIPTIKAYFDFNDAQLGTILLFMPISSLLGLPVSGWLVSRFESRYPMTVGFVMIATSLFMIGIATSEVVLIASISVFAFSTRIMSIALNTQAIQLQKRYDRKINGSFHGLWSTGGIAGVGISTVFVAFKVSMAIHFAIISILSLVVTLVAFRGLDGNERSTSGNRIAFAKPDPYIVYLGLLVFLAAVCEGGMFDWSGIYFRETVGVELFTLGYLLFMVLMATSRFVSDGLVERFGMAKMYIMSGSLICAGIVMAVLMPTFWPSLIGFCLVGFGCASVIPMTFSLAGHSKKYSPGMAISIIATYSIVGMLIGPPIIGYISHALSLRVAFLVFALMGLLMLPISQLLFRLIRKTA
ncbi:MAG: MFS transporter [Chryseolinea sp.]